MTNQKEILQHRNFYDSILAHSMTPLIAGTAYFILSDQFARVADYGLWGSIIPGAIFIGIAGITALGLLYVTFADIAKLIYESEGIKPFPKDHPVRNTIRVLAKKEGLNKMPRVCVMEPSEKIPAGMPFAGAAGHTNSGIILLSENIDKQLSPSELEGVLAHEIEHIKRNDTKTSALQNVLALPVQLMVAVHFFGTIGTALVAAVSFGNWASFPSFLPYLTAWALSLGVSVAKGITSRSFERRADRGAANLTENPYALASALERITEIARVKFGYGRVKLEEETSDNVLKIFGNIFKNLKRSHPETEYRDDRLRNHISKALEKRIGKLRAREIEDDFNKEVQAFNRRKETNRPDIHRVDIKRLKRAAKSARKSLTGLNFA